MAVMDDKEGEWSETVMLQTKESLGIDTQSVASCGTLMAKEKLILFDKAGTATTTYGYSFRCAFLEDYSLIGRRPKSPQPRLEWHYGCWSKLQEIQLYKDDWFCAELYFDWKTNRD